GTTAHSYEIDIVAADLAGQIIAIPYAASATLAGKLVPGETWTVLLTSDSDTADFSHTVSASDELSDIAGALATAITDAAGEYAATATGDTLVFARQDGAAFTVEFELTATDDTVTPLAIAVLESGYEATADGSSLVIENAADPSFTTLLNITTVFGSTGSWILDVAADKTTVNLSGALLAGEVWTITLTDTVNGSISLDFNVVDLLPEIAAALAADINGYGPATITATVEGNTILIVNRAGNDFETVAWIALATDTSGTFTEQATGVATVATLSGTPVVGDTWRLKVDGTAYEVIVGDTYDIVDVETVLPVPTIVDTLEEIAVVLAGLVNADKASTQIDVTVVGEALVLVHTGGTAFTTVFELEPEPGIFAGSISVDTTTASAATVVLSGTPQTDEVWTIELKPGTSVSVTVGGTVNSVTVTTLEELSAALVFEINNLGGYVATTATTEVTGDTIVIVKLAGDTFDPTVTVTVPGTLATVDA
ncbi:unnamed protein product, partial [marine sediment metagenome]